MNIEIRPVSTVSWVLLITVCIVFLTVVSRAFNYLPDKSEILSEENVAGNINLPAHTDFEDNEQPKSEKTLNIKSEGIVPTGDVEIMETLPEADRTVREIAAPIARETDDIFAAASEYKSLKQYDEAIVEYQKILSGTQDKDTQAKCYEEIATIYGITRRYGSALSYAQRAYNIRPTTSREVLLARLYYKTGDTDKAINRINNVLKRDFAADGE